MPVETLLRTRIDSFEKLEIIVALHANTCAATRLIDLTQTLRLPEELVRQTVLELRTAALVTVNARGEVQLLPPTGSEQEAVGELVRLYNDDRLAVVTALGRIAMERIRNMASRAFADAFLIRLKRKEDKDG